VKLWWAPHHHTALRISVLDDRERLHHVAFLKDDLERIPPKAVRQLSAVNFPAPGGRWVAVARANRLDILHGLVKGLFGL
jgi:hypothetical protein